MYTQATGVFVASSDTTVQSLAADENGQLTVMLKPLERHVVGGRGGG